MILHMHMYAMCIVLFRLYVVDLVTYILYWCFCFTTGQYDGALSVYTRIFSEAKGKEKEGKEGYTLMCMFPLVL